MVTSLNKIPVISSFVASLSSGFLLRAVITLGIKTAKTIMLARPKNELSPPFGSNIFTAFFAMSLLSTKLPILSATLFTPLPRVFFIGVKDEVILDTFII